MLSLLPPPPLPPAACRLPFAPPRALSPTRRVHGASPLRTFVEAAPGREAVEDFIREVYRRHYGADVGLFAPVLVALHDDEGAMIAAAGYRAADLAPLFLERYLTAPVECLLAAEGASVPCRRGIVEVGHLASGRAGAGRRLVFRLAEHLAAEGFDWVVSTLTEELHQLFVRLGIEPRLLGAAEPQALGPQAADWGSYYDHRPLVLAGRLQPALGVLAQRRATA